MADVASGSVLLTPRFDNLTASISDQLDGAFSGASKVGGKAGTDAGKRFSASFEAKTGAIAGIVSSVTSGAFNAISNSLGSAINRVDTMNNFPKVMKNLGYSSDDATASIKKMSASIDGLPTSLPALTGMVQQLAPLCSGLDEATNIGIAFNDMCLASGASAADVSRAMQQYSQILSKGKPDLQDWKTLQEVMPGQLNQVAKAMLGASATSKDLYSALQDGSVSMDDFNNAVLRLDGEGADGFASFAQQAKDATQGIGTALDNIPNRVSKAVQSVVDAIGAGNISGAINAFSSSFGATGTAIATVIYGIKDVAGTAIGALKSAFEGLASALPEGFLDGIVDALKQLAPAIAPALTAFALLLPVMAGLKSVIGVAAGFRSLGAALTMVAGGPVGLVIAAVAALVVGLASLYNSNETVRNAIDAAWAQIQAAAAVVWPYVQQAVSFAMTTVQTVIQTVWPIIETIVTTAMNAIMAVVQTVWPIVQTIFSTACSVIGSVVSAAWSLIQAVVSSGMAIIQAVVDTVMAVISGDWQGAWEGIKSLAKAVWEGIKSVVTAAINGVLGVISSILSAISGVWDSVWGAIKGFFSDIWEGIKGAAEGGIDAVYSTVTGIKDRIVGFFSGAGQWLVDSGRALLNGFKDGIMGAVDSVAGAVSGALSDIRGLFPFSPAKWGPFSGHGYTSYSGKALMGDFGESIAKAASSTAALASDAMGTVHEALEADPIDFTASSSVTAIRSASSRVVVEGAAKGGTYNIYLDGKLLEADQAVKDAVAALVGSAKRQTRMGWA